ncbi:MAG TPA: type II secretion system protein GspM [Steroidobacteraceae bacterium]|nr:type II secretion system protein GspM [Steroidobacteraceae bacterium]
MKLPAAVVNGAARFDAMSLRERVLIFAATLSVLVVMFDTLLLQPLAKREQALTQELQRIEERVRATASVIPEGPDATSVAEEKEQSLQATLAAVNTQLASASAGLIAPERMAEMLHEVLAHQRGLTLVDLHNEPVRSLIPAKPSTDATAAVAPPQGPFAHPVVLVVEGSYLDLLAYLRELERLPFRMYWNRLELNTVQYPGNRVRIELSTLSMDEQWLGV